MNHVQEVRCVFATLNGVILKEVGQGREGEGREGAYSIALNLIAIGGHSGYAFTDMKALTRVRVRISFW